MIDFNNELIDHLNNQPTLVLCTGCGEELDISDLYLDSEYNILMKVSLCSTCSDRLNNEIDNLEYRLSDIEEERDTLLDKTTSLEDDLYCKKNEVNGLEYELAEARGIIEELDKTITSMEEDESDRDK